MSATTVSQVSFVVPEEKQMYEVFVDSGIYAGSWQVDTQLLKTQKGTFIPYNEKMDEIDAYN